MKTILFSLLVALVLAAPVAAQVNPAFSTTTTAAITATQTVVPLTAVSATTSVAGQAATTTTLRAGYGMQIDGEYMVVAPSYVSGLQVPVIRGQLGTTAKAHPTGESVIIGPTGVFSTTTPGALGSTCPSAPAQYLIMVQTTTGNVWLCRQLTSSRRVWTATNELLLTYNSLTVR